MKYIIITGGVISGLGKGITASSIGLLLKNADYSTTMIKIDPYLNVDAGLMSPYEHGEVFVLNDGTETDLDLGNYERFLDITLRAEHNITSGKIFQSVIEDERKGVYLGKTVQIIPHITNKIKDVITKTSKIPVDINKCIPEICIIEVGGTVGDIESLHFIEAIRQLSFENKTDTFCFIHVALIIKTSVTSEQKTKPVQNSVKELRRLGLLPDLIVLRCGKNISNSVRNKISMFCSVPLTNIITNPDAETIYDVPNIFNRQNILSIISDKLNLELKDNKKMLNTKIIISNSPEVKIGIVGKYTGMADSYLSIIRALEHASIVNNCKVSILWISAEDIQDNKQLNNCDGIIIPGGFGVRGTEGKIYTAKHCRNNNIPMLGICLGLHIICIEAARNELGLDCNSYELDQNTKNPIVIPNKQNKMKLGLHMTKIKPGSLTYEIYSNNIIIHERHRHRYEINPKYISIIKKNGLTISGIGSEPQIIDIVEDSSKSFYIGCQYHPEFLSTLKWSAPLFNTFVSCSLFASISLPT